MTPAGGDWAKSQGGTEQPVGRQQQVLAQVSVFLLKPESCLNGFYFMDSLIT